MKKTSQLNTVDVNVGSFIRSWVLSTCKSDVIKIDKYSILWSIVLMNLELQPNNWEPAVDRSETISIVLSSENSRPITYDPQQNKVYRCNTLYRCYIGEAGCTRIRRYMEKQFKAAFHSYMVGALGNNPDMNIQEGIAQFLMDYNLEEHITKRMLAMLMKDWYRYRKNNPDTYGIPIFF